MHTNETSISPFRKDLYRLRHQLVSGLQERARGVDRRVRARYHREFAQAWMTLREREDLGRLQQSVENGDIAGIERVGSELSSPESGIGHNVLIAVALQFCGGGRDQVAA